MLRRFLKSAVGRTYSADSDDVQISLQTYDTRQGITDIEIVVEGQLHLIVEAKRGWTLPSIEQLMKYAARKDFKSSIAKVKAIVVLSECSSDFAKANLGTNSIDGVPVVTLSWRDLVGQVLEAHQSAGNRGKYILSQFTAYMKGVVTMQNYESNLVYVVSIARGTPTGWSISWIDIVEKKKKYFHPVGTSGWPKEPPNYIAFRYNGELQSIHHIEGYEVVTDLGKGLKEIPSANVGPHFVYELGSAIRPGKTVKTGNIYPSGRVWCMLDTLLTSNTISEARDITKKRREI